MLDVGPHGTRPSYEPPLPQHAMLAVSNPAKKYSGFLSVLLLALHHQKAELNW
jgi:hypothetical protein